MNIKDKLKVIRSYFELTRQVGHTTLLKEGANNYDKKKFVMAYSKQDHIFLDCKFEEIISWTGLNNHTFAGHKRPLIIDNGVMWVMLNETLDYIEGLEKDRKTLNRLREEIY